MYLQTNGLKALGAAQRLLPRLAPGGPAQAVIAAARVVNRPYRGPAHSVEAMHRATASLRLDPRARAVAEDVVRHLYGKDYLSEAAALYYATCRGIRYLRDPATVELVEDSEVITKKRQSDCDGLGQLLRHLVGQIGIAGAQSVTVGFTPRTTSHVFVRFKDPRGSGRYVVLDPVAGPTTATMLRRVKHFAVYEDRTHG